jgi:ParB/RepB/Spo0J family partition protein
MTMLENSDRRIEQWPLADLKPHPKQALLFPPPSQQELEELAADLEANGQLVPVEVVPGGTIVCGHKRVLAATRLGWLHITAWVRADLEARGPAAVETRLIQDNLTRRQMQPLEIARCYQHLKSLAKQSGRDRPANDDSQDLRDEIGLRLGQSGRNLDRLLRLLRTPQEVQDAVAAGRLPITVAERVASLPLSFREQVAREIAAGEDPRAVVRRHVRESDRRHNRTSGAYRRLIDALDRAANDLGGRSRCVGTIRASDLQTLDAGLALLRDLRHEADRRARKRADAGPANLDESLGALGVPAPADGAPPEPAPGGRRGRRPRG